MWSLLAWMVQGLLPVVAVNTAVVPAPVPVPVPVVEASALLTTSTMDQLRQRVADKIRGQSISTWYPGVDGNFSSSYAATDVIVQSPSTSQKGATAWVIKKNTPERPQAMSFATWPNYTTQPGTYSQTLSNGFSSTHEWSTTETIEVGVSLEVSVGIPDEAGMKETVNESISVSNTNTESKTVSQEESYTFSINVPPDTVLYAALTVTPISLEADWSATIVVDGWGFVRGNMGVPLAMQLSTFLSEAERTFRVSGSYTGLVGSNFSPCTETYPVNTQRPGRCP